MLSYGIHSKIWNHPDKDLFATRENAKYQNFTSRTWESGLFGNALLTNWSKVIYAFPPIPLIPTDLLKLKLSNIRMILIVLDWRKQWWHPELLHLSLNPHNKLRCKQYLRSRMQGNIYHLNMQSFKLGPWFLASFSMDT